MRAVWIILQLLNFIITLKASLIVVPIILHRKGLLIRRNYALATALSFTLWTVLALSIALLADAEFTMRRFGFSLSVGVITFIGAYSFSLLFYHIVRDQLNARLKVPSGPEGE